MSPTRPLSSANNPSDQSPAPNHGAAGSSGRRLPWHRRAGRIGLLLVLAPLYLLVLAGLWLAQERLLFQPEPLPADATLATDADVHELGVDVPGARLSVLQLQRPEPAGVVFFLHGNGGNLASWFVNTEAYRRANLDLVMMDYRGYGKSTGRITSQAQLQADVLAVWQQVAPRYVGKRVIVYGRSLGTGLAADLAVRLQPSLTVLVSPYQSLQALARQIYPWVPSVVLRYPLRTDLALPQIHTPVLLVHGERDTLIPPSHSLALAQAAAPGAAVTRVLIPGAAHNDLQDVPAYRALMARVLTGP